MTDFGKKLAQFCKLTIGEKIRVARKYCRPALTQKDLGDLLSKDRSTVAKWETGGFTPKPGELVPLAQRLMIPESWFFDGSNTPPPTPPPLSMLGAKLKEARTKYLVPPLSEDQLAEMLSTSAANIIRWELGTDSPQPGDLTALAQHLRLPEGWFFNDSEVNPPFSPEDWRGILTRTYRAVGFPDAGFKSIEPDPNFAGGNAPGIDPPNPLGNRGAVLGAGRRLFPIRFFVGASAHPVAGDVDGEDYEDFSDTLYRPERYCVIVVGDSGEPKVKHGDILLVQPSPEAKPGVLNIFSTPGGGTLVKIARGDDSKGWRFMPVNPEFPDLEPEEGTSMLGYVVGLKRRTGRTGYIEEGDDAGLRP